MAKIRPEPINKTKNVKSGAAGAATVSALRAYVVTLAESVEELKKRIMELEKKK